MLDLSMRDLEYVVAVDAERNITRAAERARVAQPALSQALQRIERRLGVRLFERTSRRVEPTPAGTVLAREAEAVLASVHEAVRRTRRAGGVPEGLRVHISEPSLRTPRRVLAAIRGNVPQAAIHQTTLPYESVRDQLLSGSLTFAVAGRFTGPGLHSEHLRDEAVGALVGREHPLAQEATVTLAQVARFPLLSVDEAMSGWDRWVAELLATEEREPIWTQESIFGVGAGADVLEDAITVLLTLESVSKEHLERLTWRPLEPGVTVPWFLTWATERLVGSPAMSRAVEVTVQLAQSQGWTGSDGPPSQPEPE